MILYNLVKKFVLTNLNLTIFIDNVLKSMDNGFQVDANFTDFCKAFGTLYLNVLLNKLFDVDKSGLLL